MNNNEYLISKPCEDDEHWDEEADQTLPTDPQFLRQIQVMRSTGCLKKVQDVPNRYRVSQICTGCPKNVQGVPNKYRVSQKRYIRNLRHTCILACSFGTACTKHATGAYVFTSVCEMCRCVFVFVFDTTEVFWLCLHFPRGRSTCSLCHWPTHCDPSSFL